MPQRVKTIRATRPPEGDLFYAGGVREFDLIGNFRDNYNNVVGMVVWGQLENNTWNLYRIGKRVSLLNSRVKFYTEAFTGLHVSLLQEISLNQAHVPNKCHAFSDQFLVEAIKKCGGSLDSIRIIASSIELNGYWATQEQNLQEVPFENLAVELILSFHISSFAKLKKRIREQCFNNYTFEKYWKIKHDKCLVAIDSFKETLDSNLSWKECFIKSCDAYIKYLF